MKEKTSGCFLRSVRTILCSVCRHAETDEHTHKHDPTRLRLRRRRQAHGHHPMAKVHPGHRPHWDIFAQAAELRSFCTALREFMYVYVCEGSQAGLRNSSLFGRSVCLFVCLCLKPRAGRPSDACGGGGGGGKMAFEVDEPFFTPVANRERLNFGPLRADQPADEQRVKGPRSWISIVDLVWKVATRQSVNCAVAN